MRSWLVLMVLLANLGIFQPQPAVQNALSFSNLSSDFRFGKDVTFYAKISPVEKIKDVFLFVQPGSDLTRTEKVSFDSSGEIVYRYDLGSKPLRPFVTINYWFRAVDANGQQAQSNKQSFNYEDNRFTWQKLDEGIFQVRWITGDLSFGQSILNSAQQGLASNASLLNTTVPNPLKIYVYPNSSDLQDALSLSQGSWVAGYTSPDLGVILVSIAPGPDQQVELERQIPHELMHIKIYQLAQNKDVYQNLPAWLNEGLASLAELTPNPDYQSALTQSVKSNSLLSFTTICQAFPSDASGAFLAYAESVSFVSFIHQKYGSPAFQKLISSYKTGLGCSEGVNAALGISLEQLEVRWRQEDLGMDTGALAVENLAPYLISGLLLLTLPLAYVFFLKNKPKKEKATAEAKNEL
ncbi:MAG TPA: peptidase MA family metallohydrolase [Anaerolineaceae bacterium]|nr:peptidase MA family metallohydrolase [Anaerolineaceae bacterium]